MIAQRMAANQPQVIMVPGGTTITTQQMQPQYQQGQQYQMQYQQGQQYPMQYQQGQHNPMQCQMGQMQYFMPQQNQQQGTLMELNFSLLSNWKEYHATATSVATPQKKRPRSEVALY